MVYRCAKQNSEPSSDKWGARVDELQHTPQELIDRIAARMPPPRTHRHRYFGGLAPNSPLRDAETAMSQPPKAQAEPTTTGIARRVWCRWAATLAPQAEPVQPKRPLHYLLAVLIDRIYEVFPLVCPICGGQVCKKV